ncbi:riboflavin biosynthesis protein [Leptolinea sp. HRD-7]|nr:riboflavin biosynthesis protein [Leptolinea sp. HRD-7]
MINAGSIEELNLSGSCITIGSFDGVHLGHQKIITDLKTTSIKHNLPAVVLTFFPNPAVFLKNIESPYYLTSPDEKSEILARLGIDVLVTLPFSQKLADMSASEFMERLTKHARLRELVVGCGFTMGKNRSGTVESLAEMGKSLGYSVKCISLESHDDVTISSSQIRKLIESGEVELAAKALGREYSVKGFVVKGDGRGRKIGFPTANLNSWPEKMLPAVGVYRCITELDGKEILSVGNVGFRPTFTDNTNKVFVEIHLLDYKGDLYGRELQVKFTHRLRGEVKFSSFEELVHQIHCDIKTAREL